MITNFTIFGERCSGTNYLAYLIQENFQNYEITWEYGWKHYFGFNEEKLKSSDHTLFICIVRNPVDWLNSLYRNPWHICEEIRGNVDKFLNDEFYSYNDDASGPRDGTEIMQDRNMYTGERYKDVFELRHTKLKYMIEDLPNKVKNYIFIKHEDLIEDFENTMDRIKNTGLIVKPNIQFPINTNNYKGLKNQIFKKSENKDIPSELVLNSGKLTTHYEKLLGYI